MPSARRPVMLSSGSLRLRAAREPRMAEPIILRRWSAPAGQRSMTVHVPFNREGKGEIESMRTLEDLFSP
jgi:hypothetical protein